MAQSAPDLAGFVDAQNRLRQHVGEDVVFFEEVTMVFPAGTPLDPETGRPFDPMIEPTSSGQASAAVRCSVTYRPLSGDDAQAGAAGLFDRDHVMLNAPLAAASAIERAVEFEARGDRYKITSSKKDGIGVPHRLLVFGRRKG